MKLKNKFAVIIGGSVGIGAAISKRFAEEGCDLAITYHGSSEKDEAEKLREEFKRYKIKYFYENLDVLNKESISAFFDKVKKITPKLDIAINNAGVCAETKFLDITEKEWDFIMNVNLKGMFFCCQEESAMMVKQNFGKIINTASLASKIGVPFLCHYAASKFGVLGLTFTMARELAPYNINVNAVCPGIVLTDMKKKSWVKISESTNTSMEELIEKDKLRIPLGRFAEPEDIAKMFFFLSSEDSNYITGQAFNVNGGMENH